MQYNNTYWTVTILSFLSLFCCPTPLLAKVVPSNDIDPLINRIFNYVGLLPYFRINGDVCIALYQVPGFPVRPVPAEAWPEATRRENERHPHNTNYSPQANLKSTAYADVGGKRKPYEKYIAQTAARVFFPLQQHKNIRTGSIDWPSKSYMEKMIFRGPWARGYLMTMGDGWYTYMVNVQRLSSLKKLDSRPMIIVKVKNLLKAIAPARVTDDFRDISVNDVEGKSFQILESFARGLARGDNWDFLHNFVKK